MAAEKPSKMNFWFPLQQSLYNFDFALAVHQAFAKVESQYPWYQHDQGDEFLGVSLNTKIGMQLDCKFMGKGGVYQSPPWSMDFWKRGYCFNANSMDLEKGVIFHRKLHGFIKEGWGLELQWVFYLTSV